MESARREGNATVIRRARRRVTCRR
jgi:hypothetical protein